MTRMSLAAVARFAGRSLAVLSPVIAHVLIMHTELEAPWSENRGPRVPVVVAARDIPEGAVMDFYALKVAYWPAGTVPPGAYTSVDDVDHRVARVAIYKGEVIVPSRLAADAFGPGLEVKMIPGKRAFALRVNDVTGMTDLIRPNSRVDVMVVIDNPRSSRRSDRQIAKLFMQNMRVLAIGPFVGRTADGSVSPLLIATLEVTQYEAEVLAMAASEGPLQLVLRGGSDSSYVDTRGTTASDVFDNLRRSDVPWTRPAPQFPRPIGVQTLVPRADTATVCVFRAPRRP